jgi:hypothetical protein
MPAANLDTSRSVRDGNTSTTFSILQSIRLDLGTGSQVHP